MNSFQVLQPAIYEASIVHAAPIDRRPPTRFSLSTLLPGLTLYQIPPGHFGRDREIQQPKKRRSHIGQYSIFHFEIASIVSDINEMHKIRCVCSIRRAIGVAHQLAISVVRRNKRFSSQAQKFLNNLLHTVIDCFDGFYSCFDNARVPDHIRVGEIQNDQIVLVTSGALISGFRS